MSYGAARYDDEDALDASDLSFTLKFPGECTEGVTRKGDFQPCDKPAVAIRFDTVEGGTYPVCSFHARGHMVSLAQIIEAVS